MINGNWPLPLRNRDAATADDPRVENLQLHVAIGSAGPSETANPIPRQPALEHALVNQLMMGLIHEYTHQLEDRSGGAIGCQVGGDGILWRRLDMTRFDKISWSS